MSLENNKIFLKIIKILVVGLSLFLFNIDLVSANTGINSQIPYSGTIIKNDGTALSDGSYRAKFLVYNVSSGGTAVYEEIRDGSTSYVGTGVSPAITVSDGRFEILLGSQNTTNFTNILNDDSLWLELQLDLDNNGSYEEVFSPRRRIGSAVSAINSIRLVANGSNTNSTNNLSIDSTGNLSFIGDSNTERMKILGIGNVGIGVSNPTQRLHIAGGNLLVDIASTGIAGQIQLRNPANTFQTNIQAGAQTTNITYTLPIITPTAGQILSSDASGNMSWINAGSTTGWALAGNSTTDAWNGTSGTRLGTNSAQPLVLATTNATAQDIRFFTGANGTSERMRINGDGNISVSGTFQVLSAGIMPSVGRSNNVRGIDWPDNPGGGASDNAYIYYHIDGIGENTRLEIGIDDNPEDDIVFRQNGDIRLQILNGELILGSGEQSSILNSTLLRGPDASGTNISGTNLSIRAGNGTGTGGSGAIIFSTSPVSSTGASNNIITERMRITPSGNVGIGTSSPTSRLSLPAGTATANTAPLKFTSGTNLTTAESGAMEWNGTNLFLTNSSNVRQTINQGLTTTATLDFPSTNDNSFSNLTVTVTGAVDGDVVTLGLPNASVPAAASNFTAWVSATNTVTVRFSNHSGLAQDPASGSFKVFVTKF